MANSLFQALTKNSMPNMMQVLNQVRQIQQNPGQLAQFLKDNGRINDEQFAHIQKMGTDYQQIGQYLMQTGSMPRNVGGMNGIIQQVQSQLK